MIEAVRERLPTILILTIQTLEYTYQISSYHMNVGVTMVLMINAMSTYHMNLGVSMI